MDTFARAKEDACPGVFATHDAADGALARGLSCGVAYAEVPEGGESAFFFAFGHNSQLTRIELALKIGAGSSYGLLI